MFVRHAFRVLSLSAVDMTLRVDILVTVWVAAELVFVRPGFRESRPSLVIIGGHVDIRCACWAKGSWYWFGPVFMWHRFGDAKVVTVIWQVNNHRKGFCL